MTVVLVLTNSCDGSHTESVIGQILERDSSVIRLDSDRISSGEDTLEFSTEGKILLHTHRTWSLLEATSVWLRRPYVFNFSVSNAVQKTHTENELKALLAGLWEILQDRKWLNTPLAMQRAKLKAYQLHVAKKLGFHVPDSLITSDPEEARAFCRQGQTVFKPLTESNIVNGEQTLLIPTTLLTDDHLENLDLIKKQHVLLQRFVRKSYELRITFVAGEIFVAKQVPSDEYQAATADWRLLQINRKSTYHPYYVKESLKNRIRGMMRELCLNFATLDFAVDFHGNHYFLEVNPNGQWFGYTDEIGMPASSAIAKFLTTP